MNNELTLALFAMRGALATAILNHYCRFVAQQTGQPEQSVRDEVIAEYERLMNERADLLEQKNG